MDRAEQGPDKHMGDNLALEAALGEKRCNSSRQIFRVIPGQQRGLLAGDMGRGRAGDVVVIDMQAYLAD